MLLLPWYNLLMNPEDSNLKDRTERIEALKQKLFTAKDDIVRKTRQGVLHMKNNVKIPDTWAPTVKKHVETTARIMSKPSLFKKFFTFSLIFLVLALGFAAYKFIGGKNIVSSENIVIEVLGNAFTPGGEELPLQVTITNKNSVPLEFANLIIEYPKGSDLNSMERIKKDLGTVASGKTHAENLNVILFGDQGTTRTIKVRMEYKTRGTSAIFTKDYSYNVMISNAPIVLSVEAPSDVSSNQEMTLRYKIAANSSKTSENLMLKVTYPTGFIFKSATPSPALSNNLWVLGDLGPGGQKEVELKGMLVGADGEERSFRAFVGTADENDEAKIGVVYNSILETIAIKRPFIEAKIAVNGKTGESVSVGSQGSVSAQIQWANNLPTRIDNLEIRAKLSGSAFNEESIQPRSGFYDSINDEIIWDRNTIDDFKSVSPGESGTLDFSFTPRANSGGVLVNDPTVLITVAIKGTQPGDGSAVKEISSGEKMTVKVSSSFQLAIKGLHSIGPFQNVGTIPPQAEKATSYTIVWSATNSSNKITNAEVRSTLPTYIKWMGTVSPSSEDVTYIPSTREVIWKVGTINQGTGFSSEAREMAFQVEFTPSISQVGSAPVILNDTQVTGIDQFTNAQVRTTRPKITTRISEDPEFTSGKETVIR